MKICPICNVENVDDARFCKNCGSKLDIVKYARQGVNSQPIITQPEGLQQSSNKWKMVAILLFIFLSLSCVIIIVNHLDLRHDNNSQDYIQLEQDYAQLVKSGEVRNPDGIEMVYVGVKGTDKTPNRKEGFYIGRYEVTQAQWKNIMGTSPSHFKGDNRPVESISYYDVQQFIEKLNQKTGNNYRLPTSDEWHYAAEGGIAKHYYLRSKSNTYDLRSIGWTEVNSNYQTHEVGKKQPNSLGIYDMVGNVEEMPITISTSSEGEEIIFTLGSSWANFGVVVNDYKIDNNYIYYGHWQYLTKKNEYVGFRLVLDDMKQDISSTTDRDSLHYEQK